MTRSSIITSVGLLLAFVIGWLVGRTGTWHAILSEVESPPASSPSNSSSAKPVPEATPAPLEAAEDTATVARLEIAPTNLSPAEPATPSADVVVKRLELTPSVVDEHYGLLQSTLFSAAQGLSKSCYVDLAEAMRRLVPSDSADRQRAYAAIDSFVDAQYRYRAMENTVLLEKFIWKQPPPQPWKPDMKAPAAFRGLFLGNTGTLKAGQIDFDYVLNFEEYPQLAQAHTDWLVARKTLTPFLTK